jgi:hypothetical protein
MPTYRNFVDANELLSIMQIPETLQAQRFEIIAIPVLDTPPVSVEEKT